jgi:hypothetical protein
MHWRLATRLQTGPHAPECKGMGSALPGAHGMTRRRDGAGKPALALWSDGREQAVRSLAGSAGKHTLSG